MPRSDDPNILDEDDLWRRLRPDWVINDNGAIRISSAAFWQDGEVGEISVNVARLTTKDKLLANHPTHEIGAIEAGYPRRELGFSVAFEEDPGNDGHAHLYPPVGATKSARKRAGGKIAAHARIIA
ncbi:MAG TPA: hypothetical protein VFU48_00595 [Nitrospira sp.]|nr:hypothetical protein [Nitrospira sp.]